MIYYVLVFLLQVIKWEVNIHLTNSATATAYVTSHDRSLTSKMTDRPPTGHFTTGCPKNKPKMAYSRDLPKMARQQCGIMD